MNIKILFQKKLFFALVFNCLFFGCSSFLSDEELKERYDKAIGNKNWSAVIPLLDEVIARHPKQKENYYTRAIAKSNVNPKQTQGVIEDLSVYIDFAPEDYKARYIRFQAYSILNQFDLALVDINKIIEVKGKNAFLLSWKGNCAFAAKKFKVAEKSYEERLRLQGSYEDLKNNYYYLIASKYFDGNKEGALWDCAFLENRGFKNDEKLFKLISEDKLVFEEFANFDVPQITIKQLEELLNNFCTDLDIFQSEVYFRANIANQFFRVPHTKNIEELLPKKEEVYSLNISNNNLKTLPEELSQFINLQFLNISGNKFKDKEKLVENLSKLPNLRFLFANKCYLKALPDNFDLLNNLEVLEIEANGLTELNEKIGELKKLKYISVRSNGRLTNLPKSIGQLRCLQYLNVSGGGMSKLRNELADCSELVSIVANASKIKTLPENIGNLINLKHLNLSYNKIENIPASIGNLTELEHLGIGSNEITQLPKEISNLKKLNFLGLPFNRFKEFPKEVLELDAVHNLWVHNNSFKTIPKEVGNMESLTHLLVDHQVITDNNIKAIKEVNPELRVIRNDSQRYVKGRKRKN